MLTAYQSSIVNRLRVLLVGKTYQEAELFLREFLGEQGIRYMLIGNSEGLVRVIVFGNVEITNEGESKDLNQKARLDRLDQAYGSVQIGVWFYHDGELYAKTIDWRDGIEYVGDLDWCRGDDVYDIQDTHARFFKELISQGHFTKYTHYTSVLRGRVYYVRGGKGSKSVVVTGLEQLDNKELISAVISKYSLYGIPKEYVHDKEYDIVIKFKWADADKAKEMHKLVGLQFVEGFKNMDEFWDYYEDWYDDSEPSADVDNFYTWVNDRDTLVRL